MLKTPAILLNTQHVQFPDPTQALNEPDGLLAIGGNLSSQTLISAYQKGIFPWFNDGDPILWWSPAIRTLLEPTHFKFHRSFKKNLKQNFIITCDTSFEQVINHCSQLRSKQQGTWITAQMIEAYITLHELGFAHSIEVWLNQQLVGGLYGLSLGNAFFGESMFHTYPNASKVALCALCFLPINTPFAWIDCQMPTAHLHRLGAYDIPRADYLARLKSAINHDDQLGPWLIKPFPSKQLICGSEVEIQSRDSSSKRGACRYR